ncbi:MAG: STN domain-containing protein, partial [Mangrovibacterium sp.]
MKFKTFTLNKKGRYLPRVYFILLFILLSAPQVRAQNQKITLPKGVQSISSAFEEIEKQVEMNVAYNESTIDVSQSINVDISNKPLSEALNLILKGSNTTYKIQGNQIIIIEAPKPQPTRRSLTITGTVVDAETGITIPGANL